MKQRVKVLRDYDNPGYFAVLRGNTFLGRVRRTAVGDWAAFGIWTRPLGFAARREQAAAAVVRDFDQYNGHRKEELRRGYIRLAKDQARPARAFW